MALRNPASPRMLLCAAAGTRWSATLAGPAPATTRWLDALGAGPARRSAQASAAAASAARGSPVPGEAPDNSTISQSTHRSQRLDLAAPAAIRALELCDPRGIRLHSGSIEAQLEGRTSAAVTSRGEAFEVAFGAIRAQWASLPASERCRAAAAAIRVGWRAALAQRGLDCTAAMLRCEIRDVPAEERDWTFVKGVAQCMHAGLVARPCPGLTPAEALWCLKRLHEAGPAQLDAIGARDLAGALHAVSKFAALAGTARPVTSGGIGAIPSGTTTWHVPGKASAAATGPSSGPSSGGGGVSSIASAVWRSVMPANLGGGTASGEDALWFADAEQVSAGARPARWHPAALASRIDRHTVLRLARTVAAAAMGLLQRRAASAGSGTAFFDPAAALEYVLALRYAAVAFPDLVEAEGAFAAASWAAHHPVLAAAADDPIVAVRTTTAALDLNADLRALPDELLGAVRTSLVGLTADSFMGQEDDVAVAVFALSLPAALHPHLGAAVAAERALPDVLLRNDVDLAMALGRGCERLAHAAVAARGTRTAASLLTMSARMRGAVTSLGAGPGVAAAATNVLHAAARFDDALGRPSDDPARARLDPEFRAALGRAVAESWCSQTLAAYLATAGPGDDGWDAEVVSRLEEVLHASGDVLPPRQRAEISRRLALPPS